MENVEHAVAVGALRSAGSSVVIVSFVFNDVDEIGAFIPTHPPK